MSVHTHKAPRSFWATAELSGLTKEISRLQDLRKWRSTNRPSGCQLRVYSMWLQPTPGIAAHAVIPACRREGWEHCNSGPAWATNETPEHKNSSELHILVASSESWPPAPPASLPPSLPHVTSSPLLCSQPPCVTNLICPTADS